MKFLVFLIISIVLCSCGNRTLLTTQTSSELTLIDSIAPTENLNTYNATHRNGYYPIYYIGKSSDTIRIGKQIFRFEGDRNGFKSATNWERATSQNMKIKVDTSIALTHSIEYVHYKENVRFIDSVKHFKGLMLSIKNLGDSLLHVGYFGELGYTIMQARNEKGDWVDIEIPIGYSCVTGARVLVIKPKQILIAKLMLLKGDFKTTCRLKFNHWGTSVYSNTFINLIDKKQFKDKLRKEYD